MAFTSNLKRQFNDFVDNYKNYFSRTLGATLTFTILCFVGSAFLFRFSDYDPIVVPKQVSILSYFFHQYSIRNVYSIVDLTKILFIFLVAIFSVGLTNLTKDETKKEIPFIELIRKVNFNSFFALIGTFLLASIIDFSFFKMEHFVETLNLNEATLSYFHIVLFHLRIYVPLILFALTIRHLTITNRAKITVKKILFLYISLWLFNEFAYEISLWLNYNLFKLILLPVDNADHYYLFESFLSIPLVAFYFLGYHTAMTTPLKQDE